MRLGVLDWRKVRVSVKARLGLLGILRVASVEERVGRVVVRLEVRVHG